MTTCRACGATTTASFCDLGTTPLANSYIPPSELHAVERHYPLHAVVCTACLFVQLDHVADPEEIFRDYAYFSSWSSSWIDHADRYAAAMVDLCALGPDSLVVEAASNDGYLLQGFVKRGVPVLGVEPARNVAAVGVERGIPTLTEFFGTAIGTQIAADRPADLVAANNVLAHVPDIHDFVGGFAAVLAPKGRVTIEFPHLLEQVINLQFDTIYHEHFSYLSLIGLEPVFAAHGLEVVHVDTLPTHGGSLRVHLGHRGALAVTGAPEAVRTAERRAGLDDLATYTSFGQRSAERKREILKHVLALLDSGKRVVGYGAPAKAVTLLNYCGIGPDMVEFTVDASPAKQGTLMPGCRIPVRTPQDLLDARPDVVWIMPWNLRSEITELLAPIREWGGQFFVTHPIPEFF